MTISDVRKDVIDQLNSGNEQISKIMARARPWVRYTQDLLEKEQPISLYSTIEGLDGEIGSALFRQGHGHAMTYLDILIDMGARPRRMANYAWSLWKDDKNILGRTLLHTQEKSNSKARSVRRALGFEAIAGAVRGQYELLDSLLAIQNASLERYSFSIYTPEMERLTIESNMAGLLIAKLDDWAGPKMTAEEKSIHGLDALSKLFQAGVRVDGTCAKVVTSKKDDDIMDRERNGGLVGQRDGRALTLLQLGLLLRARNDDTVNVGLVVAAAATMEYSGLSQEQVWGTRGDLRKALETNGVARAAWRRSRLKAATQEREGEGSFEANKRKM